MFTEVCCLHGMHGFFSNFNAYRKLFFNALLRGVIVDLKPVQAVHIMATPDPLLAPSGHGRHSIPCWQRST